MLDFYLLNDQQHMPPYPEETGMQFIGSLDDRTFKSLKAKRIIPERFDYYSDFRWDTTLVCQIRENIQDHVPADTDVRSLSLLLDIAIENGSGLMAYGD